MGIAQLIYKEKNKINEIELDIIVSESTNTSSTITSNPVENGSDVNDNIIINPMTFSISGIVSDTKVAPLGGLVNQKGLDRLKNGDLFTKETSPSKDTWKELLELQALKKPFILQTNLKAYDNVVIESLSVTQDKDTSNSLHFTANLKEIIFVGNKVLTDEQFNEQDTADQTTPNVEGGQK